MGILDFAILVLGSCSLVVGASQNQFQTQCSVARYPNFCVRTLQEFGSVQVQQSVDVVSLLVNRTIYEMELSSSLFSDFKLGFQEDPNFQSVLGYCKNLMKMSQERLIQALETLTRKSTKEYEHIQDIQTWLSAAITFQQTCKDSASSHYHIRKKMNHLTRHVSNSLSLVNLIQNTTTFQSTNGQSQSQHKSTTGIPQWVSARDRKLIWGKMLSKADAVVSKDGSGDYKTVKEAIEAAPANSGGGRFVIYVKAGVYKEKIRTEKRGITLIGEGMYRSVIDGDDSVDRGASMPASATFTVTGDGFMARDMGFKNSAGAESQQAVALTVGSDWSVLYRCSISGNQDTLYAVAFRQFYRDCHIYGTVDFIFGNAAAVFQNCELLLRRPAPNSGRYNVVLAHGRTDPGQTTGFSVQNCRIVPDSEFLPSKRGYESYLGRPWKKYARSVVMGSYIDDAIAGSGWVGWLGGGTGVVKTLYFAEYGNSGPGSGITKRVNWPGFHVIGPDRALKFTAGNFIAANSWLPQTGVPFVSGLK